MPKGSYHLKKFHLVCEILNSRITMTSLSAVLQWTIFTSWFTGGQCEEYATKFDNVLDNCFTIEDLYANIQQLQQNTPNAVIPWNFTFTNYGREPAYLINVSIQDKADMPQFRNFNDFQFKFLQFCSFSVCFRVFSLKCAHLLLQF